MTAYRWRSYVVELVSPDSSGLLYLTNISEVRRLFGYFMHSCAHGANALIYRLERVWFDNGFEVEPSPGEAIRFPRLIESGCVCELARAIS